MSARRHIFAADRATYIRVNTWLAALAMGGAMVVLWLIDSPHVWTGAIAGLAAIGLRAWYLASDELAAEWVLEGDTLTGPGDRRVPLARIASVRSMGAFVQVITRDGDKHLIKYRPDPAATLAEIEAAAARGRA